MDSVSQIVLGASVAGFCAPAGQRRRALLLGAALGTLPDLDVLIDYGDPVRNFTYHRGFSHSLFVLVPFAAVLWSALRRWWAPVRAAPWRWLAAIQLALVTHPLLDAHTAYGTQLWWPLSLPPTSWSTVFIIDPLYTLPLLIGTLTALIRPQARGAAVTLAVGLALSTAYLGWSWIGRATVQANAEASLARIGLTGAPMFLTPTPFNTLLWRVVVLTPDGYLEGYDSMVVDDGPTRFQAYPSDIEAMRAASNVWAVARLRWFAQDFLKATVLQDRLILADLRMGDEPSYVFSYAVAGRGNPHWTGIPVEQLPAELSLERLGAVWERIWSAGVPRR